MLIHIKRSVWHVRRAVIFFYLQQCFFVLFFVFVFLRDHSEFTMANLFNTHETSVMYILYTYMQFKDMIRIRQSQVLNQCINVYNFFHAKLSAFFIYS